MSKKKGDRRESLGVDIFENAGFTVETPNHVKFSNKDYFNLMDFMAVHPNTKVIFVQVKSETARNIREFEEQCKEIFSSEHTIVYYLVYHKREGWRLIEIDLDNGTHTVVADGRDSTDNMGVHITNYLQENLTN